MIAHPLLSGLGVDPVCSIGYKAVGEDAPEDPTTM